MKEGRLDDLKGGRAAVYWVDQLSADSPLSPALGTAGSASDLVRAAGSSRSLTGKEAAHGSKCTRETRHQAVKIIFDVNGSKEHAWLVHACTACANA